MLYLTFVQYMKHGMQITQEPWEYYFKLHDVYATNDFSTVRR